jgi:hypothetical protein
MEYISKRCPTVFPTSGLAWKKSWSCHHILTTGVEQIKTKIITTLNVRISTGQSFYYG